MKKLILPIAVLAMTATACRKDRVCECKATDGTTVTAASYTDIKKKEAKTNCNAIQAKYTDGTTCVVK